MATAAVALVLLALGAGLVWEAWRGAASGAPRRERAASPVGLAGGITVLGGLTVAVSGLDTPPGALGASVGVAALVAGAVLAGLSRG